MSSELIDIQKTSKKLQPDIERFLCELIKFPSTPGKEYQAMEYLYEQFSQLDVEVEKILLSDDLKSDPDYSSPIPGIKYDGRFNLRICKKGKNSNRKILFNAHVDVVPPSEGMTEPYSGKVEKGIIYGRGACDDKGPLVSLYMLYKLLEGVQPECDIVSHLVVEEENGGNGSLAMVRNGEKADCCIVLEPTENKVLSTIRGAVWFKLEFFGKAGHSGQAGQTKSALLMAKEAIDILTDYHKDLLASSKGIELFDKYENPMPITFGRLEAGNWPASAPSYASMEGVLGFLLNKTKEQIVQEMQDILVEKGVLLDADNFKLCFTYRHDCSVVSPDSEFVKVLLEANTSCSIETEIDAMPASCDAWFYNNQLGIPTVVYGPGTLKVAHSKDEHIAISDVVDAAKVLYKFVNNYGKTK